MIARAGRPAGRIPGEKMLLLLCLLATSAAAVATPALVFTLAFSLSVLSTGLHLTRGR
ncbi:MAG: hypothetical protein DIU74_003740 [Pseudomonadota bacterium]